MIDKVLLVLSYYLTLPWIWAVAALAALLVVRGRGWVVPYLIAAGVTWAWLVGLTLCTYRDLGAMTVAKSYVPVAMVAAGVMFGVMRALRALIVRPVQDKFANASHR